MEEVKSILIKLEDIVRGRPCNEENLILECKEAFNWASNSASRDALMSTEARNDSFKLAINLHNKLRVLPAHLLEVKAYLKGTAAWMMRNFGDSKPSSAFPYIKAFFRASQELFQFSNDGKASSLKCINQALIIWKETTAIVFERSLNPIDYSELKTFIVKTYQEKITLYMSLHYNKNDSYSIKEIKQCLSGAMEIIQSLTFPVKLKFSRTVALIGSQFSETERFEDATYCFSVALGNLDSVSKSEIIDNAKGDERMMANFIWMKIKTNLCLSYVFREQNMPERAMECVRIAESMSEDPLATACYELIDHGDKLVGNKLKISLMFSKFMINRKACDWEAAVDCLHPMIDNADSNTLSIVLESIEALVSDPSSCNTRDIMKLYDALLERVKDTSSLLIDTRLSYLKSQLLKSVIPEDLCSLMVTDHLNIKHVMNSIQIKTLKSILNERIISSEVSSQFIDIISWCDIYLRLWPTAQSHNPSSWDTSNFIQVGDGWFWGESCVSTWQDSSPSSGKEDMVLTLLKKAKALFSLRRYDEAFDTAFFAVNAQRNTKSVAILFLCSIFKFKSDPDKTMSLLLRALCPFKSADESRLELNSSKPIPSILESRKTDSFTTEFKLATLNRIICCSKLLSEYCSTSGEFFNDICHMLLSSWLDIYCLWEVWRHNDIQSNEADDLDDDFGVDDRRLENNYLSVLRSIFANFKKQYYETIVLNQPENNKIELAQDQSVSHSPKIVERRTDSVALGVNDKTYDEDPDLTQRCDVENPSEDASTPKSFVYELVGNSNHLSIESRMNSISNDLKLDDSAVTIHCSLQTIKVRILEKLIILKQLIDTLEGSNTTLSVLGSSNSMQYLAHFSWNLGAVYLSNSKIAVDGCNKLGKDRLILCAQLLEHFDACLQHIYFDDLTSFENKNLRASQSLALTIASAARLDCNKLSDIDSNSKTILDIIPEQTESERGENNLNQSLIDIRRASQLSNCSNDYQDENFRLFESKCLILEFKNLCCRKVQNDTDYNQSTSLIPPLCDIDEVVIPKLKNFYDQNLKKIMLLTPMELENCANLAKFEIGGCLETARNLLSLAIQISTRAVYPDYKLIGSMYLNLIKISPNRKKALSMVEEFDQLLDSVAQLKADENEDSLPFCLEDIDGICATAYNFGLSVYELEMFDLAERFVCKALSIFRYTSTLMAGWKSNLQGVYASILRAKSNARVSSSKTDVSLFGMGHEKMLHDEKMQALINSSQASISRDTALTLKMFE